MKFKTGYLYHVITGIIFIFAALWLVANKDSLENIQKTYRHLLIGVMVAWGIFRFANGYFLYKKEKREEHDRNA
jgi:hypothetical protein